MRKVSLRIALIAMGIFIIGMMSISAWAVPGVINFQGKLIDPNNIPKEDNDYFMTFRIYTVQTEGTQLWMEVQKVKVSEGIYNVQLGEITPLPGDLFDNEELYLEISIFNYSENQDEILSPRQRLTSTPYAMKAAKSGDADTLAGKPSAYYAVATHIHDDLKPAHQWSGTSLRFENPDGSWGSYVNLKGDKGDQYSPPPYIYVCAAQWDCNGYFCTMSREVPVGWDGYTHCKGYFDNNPSFEHVAWAKVYQDGHFEYLEHWYR